MSVNDKKMIEEICEQIRNLTKEDLNKAFEKVDLEWKKSKHIDEDK